MVLATAIAVTLLSQDVSAITGWALDVLGAGFLSLLAGLIFATLFSLVRMNGADIRNETGDAGREYWFAVGMQAANGVTTLALTFTLLGISLGIGSLAGQNLTPETVQTVIRDLTANFSLAFMTTVVGLPVSAGLRALLVISLKKPVPEERTVS
jgi:CBS domain containing-hemolysin-like protein